MSKKKNEHYFSEKPISKFKEFRFQTYLKNILCDFITAPGIFSYKKIDLGTQVLIKKMEIPTNGLVLDLGCGYGVVGVFLGKFNANLTIHLIDVNLRAIELTKKNLELNNVKKYQVFTGDLQIILKQNNYLYDAIYFNPPIRIGKKKYISIIMDVLEYLKKDGMFFIVIKHNLGAESAYQEIINELEQRNIEELYETRVIAKNSGYWIIKISRE